MSRRRPSPVDAVIDRNLKLAFDAQAEVRLPDHLLELIARLRREDASSGDHMAAEATDPDQPDG